MDEGGSGAELEGDIVVQRQFLSVKSSEVPNANMTKPRFSHTCHFC
jgi:hypothetical protein